MRILYLSSRQVSGDQSCQVGDREPIGLEVPDVGDLTGLEEVSIALASRIASLMRRDLPTHVKLVVGRDTLPEWQTFVKAERSWMGNQQWETEWQLEVTKAKVLGLMKFKQSRERRSPAEEDSL